MIDCPCGKYKIDSKESICPHCGILLRKIRFGTTTHVGDTDDEDAVTRLGTARFNPRRMMLVLRVRDTGREYAFNGGEFTSITLGRIDPETGDKPDVDLTQDDGVNKGVSRKHAVIMRKEEGTLSIIDKGAANYTFLNGTRLIPNQPRMLRDSDELRLGKLVILVRYMQIPQHKGGD
jgi:hypothetical protein